MWRRYSRSDARYRSVLVKLFGSYVAKLVVSGMSRMLRLDVAFECVFAFVCGCYAANRFLEMINIIIVVSLEPV